MNANKDVLLIWAKRLIFLRKRERRIMVELQIGSKLKNRYEIRELLGKGGFGCTYKAIDHLLNRFVAIKCSEQSLSHEVKILKALQNVPNICHLYDYFVADKKHYVVMRYIQGKSMSGLRAENGGTISIQVLKQLLPSLLITLDQMHERGIIHRDISPGNLLVTEDNRLFLIDFGAATSVKESHLMNSLIFAHKGLDAPEHNDLAAQGPWTDIYSLCTTIIFLLTGEGIPAPEDRRNGDPVATMLTRLSLTGKMQNALLKGLSLNIERRYKSIQAFANDFFSRSLRETELQEKYSVHYHARTDIGVRKVNQDNFMVDTLFAYCGEDCEIKGYIDCEPDELHVVAIADGVASSQHGELASKAAIQAVSHFIDYYRNDEGLHENLVEEFLNQLNEKILILSEKIGKTATTITLLLWRKGEYCIANIGDSPAFLLHEGHLERLTDEHTLAKEKIAAGEAVTSKDFHTLTRYLGKKGIAGSEMASIKTGTISKGDIFMLCSDGISGATTDDEKKKFMKRDGDKAIRDIFKCAHKHPAMDNCSAIILKF